MSATFAPSAAPPNALLMWTDGRNIYIELKTKPHLPPCILTYPRHEQGLTKALALLGKHATDLAGPPILSYPKAVRKADPQAAQAQAVLRRMGILK